jgi:hypothetical protein
LLLEWNRRAQNWKHKEKDKMTQQQIQRQIIQAIQALTEATKAITEVAPTIPVSPLFANTPEVLAVRELDRAARAQTRSAVEAVRQFAGV